MKAIMLAAGVGRRLYGDDYDQPPKALLNFGGKTLLSRHIEVLQDNGVDELILVLGHRKEEILAEAVAIAGKNYIRWFHNPRYRGGAVLSLWTAREVLRSGEDVLFMDADVLYHPELIGRLIHSAHQDCFLFDSDIEPGEEPVKLCIRDGVPVEFGKKISGDFDAVGEWPGFLKMSPRIAELVADACDAFVEEGRLEATYEEAIRRVVLAEPDGAFGYEDISDVPWIEIDFPADLLRAENHILPRINEMAAETEDGAESPAPSSISAS
ncbi:MAG: phosphocholine cytidylyltransferase family protein [Rhodospirillales bacterium]|nr:phosphocholine cytidylyltransferase family protein [Rhodospirillales bacterium]